MSRNFFAAGLAPLMVLLVFSTSTATACFQVDPYGPKKPGVISNDGTPQPAQSYLNEGSGGTGMVIAQDRAGYIEVLSVLTKSPAAKAGLRVGDHIIAVDGKETTGMSMEEVTRLIRGAEGRKVKLDVRSGSSVRRVAIKRVFTASSYVSSNPFPKQQ